MMRSDPFLQEQADVKMWSRLDEIDSSFRSGKEDKAKAALTTLVEEMSISLNPFHSAVLVRILRIAIREKMDDLPSIALKVMEKCSLSDTLPALESIEILISAGNLDMARYIMDRLTVVADLAFFEYEKGRMKLSEGEHDAARDMFIRVYNTDPSFIKVYDRLIELDGITDEWEIRRNIALLMNGMPTELAGRSFPNSNMESLYRIYWEWYKGEIRAAKNMLDVSVGNESIPDFRLAAARIYNELGDIETSVRFYRDSAAAMPEANYVKTELAIALIQSERMDEALIVLGDVERVDPFNRGMMESKMRALSALGKKADLREYCNTFLGTEHADRDGHVFAATMLSECGETTEAGKIIDRLIAKFQNDPSLLVLRSSNELKAERYAAALSTADEAVRMSSKDPSCRYQRARILNEMGRTKKAMRDIDAALNQDPKHLPSLALQKDMRIDQKDYEGAMEICDTILRIDPMNQDVMKDKAYALDILGRKEESLDEYRNALRLRRDPQLYEEVLTLLVRTERYDELKALCAEFETMYGNNAMVWRLKGNAEYACGEYEDAMASFAKSADLAPFDPEIWHSRGMAAENAGQLKKAEESFDKALLLDLDNPEYWLSRAVIQERRNNLIGAVKSLNRVITETPDSTFALMRKALILVRMERYEEAIFFIDLALKINSKDVAIHEIKKEVLKHNSRFEQVVKASDDMLLVDPKNFEALRDRTEALLSLGQYDDAIGSANSALEVDPDSMEILEMKKSAAKNAGDHKATEEACRQILTHDPGNRDVRMDLADALAATGDSESAIMIYDQLHAEDPLDVKVTVMKAKVRSDIGDDSEAVELFQEILENRPDDPDTLVVLANVMLEQGFSDESVRVLDRALSINPKDVRSMKMKSRILIDDRRPDDAYDVLRDALRLKPNDPDIWMMMGEVQEHKGDMHQALLSYDSAMKMGVETPELYATRGRVQEALGMDEAAINSFSLAALKDQGDVNSLVEVAKIQIRLGRLSAAAQNLDTALKRDPDNGAALYNRARVHKTNDENDEMMRLYARFRELTIDDPEISMRFRELVGDNAADDIPGTYQRTFRDDVEMYSNDILKYCYDTREAIRSDETFRSNDVPEELEQKILDYLGSIDEYGEIRTDSREFERLEYMSKNLIINENMVRIDSEPLVGLPAAYMASGAKNIDEAKKLVAYIYKVMTEDIELEVYPDDVVDAARKVSSMAGDIGVYDIMESFDLGICHAKMASSLSSRMSDSITFHV